MNNYINLFGGFFASQFLSIHKTTFLLKTPRVVLFKDITPEKTLKPQWQASDVAALLLHHDASTKNWREKYREMLTKKNVQVFNYVHREIIKFNHVDNI